MIINVTFSQVEFTIQVSRVSVTICRREGTQYTATFFGVKSDSKYQTAEMVVGWIRGNVPDKLDLFGLEQIVFSAILFETGYLREKKP